MQNYKLIFILDLTESEASVTDAYNLDGSLAGVKSVIIEDMEEEAPPAKEPDEQIIIGKKCPFLSFSPPLQGLKCRTTHLYFYF